MIARSWRGQIMANNELVAGILEATILFAPAILSLTMLSVWLGWKPVPARVNRLRRLVAAICASAALVVGFYALGSTGGQAGTTTAEALVLLVPAGVFFVVGAGGVAFVYLRRDQIGILRLVVTWLLATFGTAMLVAVVIGVVSLAGGLTVD
jgi:hypothetical protein